MHYQIISIVERSADELINSYHLGQSEVGAEFSDSYVGFNDVLAAFASFAEGAISTYLTFFTCNYLKLTLKIHKYTRNHYRLQT